jgi:hypothetical protein
VIPEKAGISGIPPQKRLLFPRALGREPVYLLMCTENCRRRMILNSYQSIKDGTLAL